MLDSLAGTTAGKMLVTFILSMVPVTELRIALPYALVSLHLSWPLAFLASVLGNVFPVPFIVTYIQEIFRWLREHLPKLDAFITRLEKRAGAKGERVRKYGPIGLLLFVAIPLPGTGAWTGSLIAALLGIKPRTAFFWILVGVIIAGCIVSLATFGVIHVV